MLYGLDLAMENTGVVVFDHVNGIYAPVYVTTISTTKLKTKPHGIRLKHIATELVEISERYPPKAIAIERGFSRFNNATQAIFRVHGLVNYLFHNVKQTYYPPKTVKEAILKGNATKAQLRKKIELEYPDIEFANEDESDAFSVALTWLIKNDKISWDKSMRKK